jgi:hypothetical protein
MYFSMSSLIFQAHNTKDNQDFYDSCKLAVVSKEKRIRRHNIQIYLSHKKPIMSVVGLQQMDSYFRMQYEEKKKYFFVLLHVRLKNLLNIYHCS